ncbi:MAG TPA: M23 family metallopeptidase [Bacteroidales bacterium]|jgi:murein DD-endopeptidase MepM/ murein hydrolase activator NlpD|nr:M23 family metallopeptidase [Bacteroidales bacterium]HOS57616.1 M23 family metallopeptidase [Bacteroidales bacterium]HPY80382.1 M23 family metallopeptidase [Bacteroidales bacterium]HRR04416.1 M23 family metallopeptidase [Bacteroidales bacterium]HRT13348.1 M23 family metallopeptidase [Bacteroidales bacterium]
MPFLNQKFRFNKKELRRIIVRILWFGATALSFAVLVIWISFYLFNSPREKMLQRENNELKLALKEVNSKLNSINLVLDDIQDRDDYVYRAIFETDPIDREERYPFLLEQSEYADLSHDEAIELIRATSKKTDRIMLRLALQSRSLDTVNRLVIEKEKMLQSIPAIRPIKNMSRVASGFGMRYHPILKTLRRHAGIDISAPRGTPVYATANGVVTSENAGSGYGINIVINHGYSYKTVYAHLSKKAVRAGQRVIRGQLIGYVGNTGLSMGAHLHYEVHKNGIPVNPVHFFFSDITPKEYDEILETSKKINQALS